MICFFNSGFSRSFFVWDVPERYQACDFSLYVLLLYTAEKNRGAAYLSIPPTACCGKFAAG